VHNSLYWRGAEFLGLGAGAASFRRIGEGGRRWSNHRSVGRYLAAAPEARVADGETLTAGALAADLIWLGLRTRDGVAADALDRAPALRDWLLGEAGLCVAEGDRVRPTVRGFLYSNRVLARVLEALGAAN
jgi:coproporphyrinogen III oxidase-like Fe-S oxidoreductase